MAKTAEEKAAIQAQKDADKQARDEAKAQAKAERQAEKAQKQAEKDQIVNLKSAGKAEIMAYEEALSDSGLSKKEIKELLKLEKQANKTEVREAKEILSADGLQWIGSETTGPDGTVIRGPILSTMDTIGEEYQPEITEDLQGALSYYKDYGLPTLSERGNTTIGFALDKILKAEYSRDPETGDYTLQNNFTKTLDRAQDYVKNTFTAEELQDQGVRLKQDKNNPNLYTWKFGSDEKTGYIFFKQNEDGTFTGVGANRMAIDMPGGALAEVFRDVPFLPEIAAIGASFIPGAQPFVGEIYALGKGLQADAMGGDFGDVIKAAGLAYLGQNVLPGTIKNFLPADIAAIPGVTQGLTRTASGLLQGQDFEDALMSGVASGIGSYAGSELSGLTGSPNIGKIGGALTTTALSGGDITEGLKGALTNLALQEGVKQVGIPDLDKVSSQMITDPTARRIAESSLSRIIKHGITGTPPRPDLPIPVPGFVRRQFAGAPAGTMNRSIQPLRPILPKPMRPGEPVMAAQGGRIGPPLRRNVAELIPLNRGGLSVLRG